MSFDPDNPLATEIQQEMASSYFAACRKMVDAIEALKAFDRRNVRVQLEPAPAQIVERTQLVAAARERVFYVVIQRESMKVSTFESFFEDYEISDEIRTKLGPAESK